MKTWMLTIFVIASRLHIVNAVCCSASEQLGVGKVCQGKSLEILNLSIDNQPLGDGNSCCGKGRILQICVID
jgi:hypothetical protein